MGFGIVVDLIGERGFAMDAEVWIGGRLTAKDSL